MDLRDAIALVFVACGMQSSWNTLLRRDLAPRARPTVVASASGAGASADPASPDEGR